MLLWLGMQSVVSILFLLTGVLTGKGPLWATGGELPYVISVLANGVTFLLGYLWLQKKKKETSGQERRFSLGAAVKLLAVGVIFQMIVSLLLAGMQVVFPKAMESYAQVLENLGVFAPSVFSVLYTVVFAPLTEEMVFRGVTLRILQEELPFAAANVLQAVLFALMHGNVGNCCEKIRKTQCSHMVSFCSQCFRFISGRHQRTWNLSFAGNQFRSSLGICHNR